MGRVKGKVPDMVKANVAKAGEGVVSPATASMGKGSANTVRVNMAKGSVALMSTARANMARAGATAMASIKKAKASGLSRYGCKAANFRVEHLYFHHNFSTEPQIGRAGV